ncbi:MAG: ABC transporter ATP-binding protein/permease [Oscillospiraceae bacterium]|jgi:ATP-binding cassette subfamily B protein|nr:ABC transporter ATP-binding protein/permease [Oscillospiraceae bacterium]
MNENLKLKKYPFIKVMLRIIPISYKATPWHNIFSNLAGIIHGASFAVSVIATQLLFDAVSNAAMGNGTFRDCVFPMLVLAGITFGQQIINGAHNFHAGVLFSKSSGKITTILHRKLQRIDPSQFEDTDFLDDVNKAREGVQQLPYVSMTISIFIFFYGAYFASIGAYLFSLKPILLITILIAFIPAMLAQVVRAKVFAKLEEQSAPLRRQYDYYKKTLCDREYFKETRILGAYNFFHKLFADTMTLLTRKTWRAERKTALLQLALNTTSFAGMAIAAYMLFTATMAGEITVGAFAAVFATLSMLFYIMQEIIVMHIGNMNRDIGKVTNFVRILDLPERTGISDFGTPDFAKGIVAENISFTYPGRDEPAVKNVSLSIAAGETIAIVGENGAGKSTLVRLLTGVYHPSEGVVTVGGLDTARASPSSVFKGISGVFQKYQRYKMTLNENVAISDIDIEVSAAEVETALSEAYVELDGVEANTMLSPEFDGIDLSGGQWQRLAIARGLYRKNDFIVLDEPTAAIDPIEETRVYTQFQKLAEGKCAVIVTHRLGSAKLAHRIIVMDAGEIVDSGTHEELLACDGKYTEMWSAQAMWYERE